jgi:hypothetical protein
VLPKQDDLLDEVEDTSSSTWHEHKRGIDLMQDYLHDSERAWFEENHRRTNEAIKVMNAFRAAGIREDKITACCRAIMDGDSALSCQLMKAAYNERLQERREKISTFCAAIFLILWMIYR